MKGNAIALAVILSALLVGPVCLAAPDAPPMPVKDFSKATALPVMQVIDGNTIVLKMDGKNAIVRLLGMDTADISFADTKVKVDGKVATRFLTNLLTGESVYVEKDPAQDKDKDGRALLYVYRAPDGLFVNLEAIRRGLARTHDQPAFAQVKLYAYYEDQARTLQRGLWNPDAAAALAPEDLAQKITLLEAEKALLQKQVTRLNALTTTTTITTTTTTLNPRTGRRGMGYTTTTAAYIYNTTTTITTASPRGTYTSPTNPSTYVTPTTGGSSGGSSGGPTVYVTKDDIHYHNMACKYLNSTSYGVSLADAKAAGKTPCTLCRPPQ